MIAPELRVWLDGLRRGHAVPPPAAYAIARECWDTLVASQAGGFRLAGGDIWVEPEREGAQV